MTTTHRYKAAVIIPSRGGADILHYPLDALAAQTEKDFQVIVVLDGDIDNSEAVLDRYIAEGKLNLTKIVFEENRGRVAALNAGHRAADADVLIRCDDDLEPAADYVEARIRLHRDYDGVIGTLKNVYPDTPYSRVYGNFRDARFKEGALSVAEEGRWLYWNGNSSISAEYFDRTGGYDPAYRLYGWEDVDMGKMVHDAGGRIIISDEVEVKHYAEATTTAVRALRALHSGSARTARKHTLPRTRRVRGGSWSRPSLVSPPRRPLRLWAMRAIRFCSSCLLRLLRSLWHCRSRLHPTPVFTILSELRKFSRRKRKCHSLSS